VALNKDTGATVWTSSGLNEQAQYSSVVAVEFQGHPTIVQMVKSDMVAVDPSKGRFFWRNQRAGGGATALCATPVYCDGYCFGAAGYGRGGWNCLELKTGRKKWDGRGVGKGSCYYADGTLYTFG
jgi:outer membrane protein assembly factor BamB